MADLQSILTDPNYVSANPETKAAIFDKHAPTDPNFANANPETQAAIRQKFGLTPGGATPADVSLGMTGAGAAIAPIADAALSLATGAVATPVAGIAAIMEQAGLP